MKQLTGSIFLLFCALFSHGIFAQDAQWPKSNYVTIGVFRVMDNAVRYTEKANKSGFAAQYAINPKYKLYYVYLLNEDELMKAYIFMSKIRKETEYKDAWIFVGSLGTEPLVRTEPKPEPKVEPKPEPKIEPKPEPVKEPEKVVETPPVAKDTVKVKTPVVDSAALKKKEEPVVAKKPKGKPFYFKVVSKEDGKELKGNIQLEEAIGATQYRLIKSGEITYLEPPTNPKGLYGVITQIPGYKESLLSFEYANPQGEKGSQNENIITLTLEKATKGDYIDFNNVHFFKNTSVMQPESQNEVDALVNMMKENPKYRIKIYGYVNGKKQRQAVTMGKSTKFFALDKSNGHGTLSAKDLSLACAETLKSYLVSQGISADRIATKGEGGAVPIYPEDGNLAHLNDRVEIEFVKSK